MMQPTAAISQIDVPEGRARDFDPVWAEALAAMIAEQGLLNPVTVRVQENGRYLLVAGLHRLRALEQLGRKSIPITLSQAGDDDRARLDEVMENLGRFDLIALDRCHHLHVLKTLWLKLHPEVKNGGARPGAGRPKSQTGDKASQKIKSQKSASEFKDVGAPVFGFARDLADKVGLGPAMIKRAVRIWTRLLPESKQRLVGTDLARKETELKALADLEPRSRQAEVLDLILGDAHPEIQNVAQAEELLDNKVLQNALEKRFATLSKTFASLKDPELDDLLAANEARVIDSLQRRGRI